MSESGTPDGVVQAFGTLRAVRIGLATEVRYRSVSTLNRLLAHTIALRDLYKKAHWQTSGPSFFELHVLFDRHYEAQSELMDAIAERVQTLGGVAIALAGDVAHQTRLARGQRGSEDPAHQLRGLLDAHETVLVEARPLARRAADDGDDGTNDLIVSQIIRMNERQGWFIAEHLASRPGTAL